MITNHLSCCANSGEDIKEQGGNVLIHPRLPYNFIELTPKFYKRAIKDLNQRIFLCASGIDEPQPVEQLLLLLLENAEVRQIKK